jgi:rhodanese-related sulfurtransferase
MNKKIGNYISFGFLSLLIIMIPACGWLGFGKKDTDQSATTATTQTTDTSVEKKSLKIVDVNEEKIYKDAHIAGAVNIAYDNLEQEAAQWDKNTPIVTYCTTYECTESHRAAKKLRELGFTNVRVYEGGMNDWYKHAQDDKAAYPYEGPASENYLTKQVSKPESKENEIPTITAEEIKDQLVKAPEKA